MTSYTDENGVVHVVRLSDPDTIRMSPHSTMTRCGMSAPCKKLKPPRDSNCLACLVKGP